MQRDALVLAACRPTYVWPSACRISGSQESKPKAVDEILALTFQSWELEYLFGEIWSFLNWISLWNSSWNKYPIGLQKFSYRNYGRLGPPWGGGGGGTQVKFGWRFSVEALNLTMFKTKIAHFATLFKTEKEAKWWNCIPRLETQDPENYTL